MHLALGWGCPFCYSRYYWAWASLMPPPWLYWPYCLWFWPSPLPLYWGWVGSISKTELIIGNFSWSGPPDHNENRHRIHWPMYLSLPPRLCLNGWLYSLFDLLSMLCPLSLGNTRSLATDLLTGGPFAPDLLLSLSSQLAMSLTTPIDLWLVPLGYQSSLNYISKMSQTMNLYSVSYMRA